MFYGYIPPIQPRQAMDFQKLRDEQYVAIVDISTYRIPNIERVKLIIQKGWYLLHYKIQALIQTGAIHNFDPGYTQYIINELPHCFAVNIENLLQDNYYLNFFITAANFLGEGYLASLCHMNGAVWQGNMYVYMQPYVQPANIQPAKIDLIADKQEPSAPAVAIIEAKQDEAPVTTEEEIPAEVATIEAKQDEAPVTIEEKNPENVKTGEVVPQEEILQQDLPKSKPKHKPFAPKLHASPAEKVVVAIRSKNYTLFKAVVAAYPKERGEFFKILKENLERSKPASVAEAFIIGLDLSIEDYAQLLRSKKMPPVVQRFILQQKNRLESKQQADVVKVKSAPKIETPPPALKPKELTVDQKLKLAVNNGDYLAANELLKDNPKLKKSFTTLVKAKIEAIKKAEETVLDFIHNIDISIETIVQLLENSAIPDEVKNALNARVSVKADPLFVYLEGLPVGADFKVDRLSFVVNRVNDAGETPLMVAIRKNLGTRSILALMLKTSDQMFLQRDSEHKQNAIFYCFRFLSPKIMDIIQPLIERFKTIATNKGKHMLDAFNHADSRDALGDTIFHVLIRYHNNKQIISQALDMLTIIGNDVFPSLLVKNNEQQSFTFLLDEKEYNEDDRLTWREIGCALYLHIVSVMIMLSTAKIKYPELFFPPDSNLFSTKERNTVLEMMAQSRSVALVETIEDRHMLFKAVWLIFAEPIEKSKSRHATDILKRARDRALAYIGENEYLTLKYTDGQYVYDILVNFIIEFNDVEFEGMVKKTKAFAEAQDRFAIDKSLAWKKMQICLKEGRGEQLEPRHVMFLRGKGSESNPNIETNSFRYAIYSKDKEVVKFLHETCKMAIGEMIFLFALQSCDDKEILMYLLERHICQAGRNMLHQLVLTTTKTIFPHYIPILANLLTLDPETTKSMVKQVDDSGANCLTMLMSVDSKGMITREQAYYLFEALLAVGASLEEAKLEGCEDILSHPMQMLDPKLLDLFLRHMDRDNLKARLIAIKTNGLTVKGNVSMMTGIDAFARLQQTYDLMLKRLSDELLTFSQDGPPPPPTIAF